MEIKALKQLVGAIHIWCEHMLMEWYEKIKAWNENLVERSWLFDQVYYVLVKSLLREIHIDWIFLCQSSEHIHCFSFHSRFKEFVNYAIDCLWKHVLEWSVWMKDESSDSETCSKRLLFKRYVHLDSKNLCEVSNVYVNEFINDFSLADSSDKLSR